MPRPIASLLLLLVVTVTGCLSANYEDVSRTAPCRRLNGRTFRTRRDLEIVGITDDPSCKPPVDYYFIEGPPGIGGREVLYRGSLAAGSVVEVTRILHCTNCPFDEIYRIQVTIRSTEEFRAKPVFIVNVRGLAEIEGDNGLTLNAEFFEPTATPASPLTPRPAD